MASDPRKLKPSELCRLLNSTPLGEVISERQLYRHRQRAGARIGDNKTVDLLRYCAWMHVVRHTPRTSNGVDPYDAMKERARARNAALALAGRDIGELPEVDNADRKDRASRDFRYFCETYFPLTFNLPWSVDHVKVIGKIEQAVLHGGLFAMAMPRGAGKALALDTPLPTPFGWTTMGDVKVGDCLFDEEGWPCRVIAATPIFFDRPCYRVTFSDGESIVCDENHQWQVDDEKSSCNPWVLTTASMASKVTMHSKRNCRRHRYRINVSLPLVCLEKDLPISPYLLGYWLGDGDKSSNQITTHYDDLPHLITELRKIGELASWKRRSKGNVVDVTIGKGHSVTSEQARKLRRAIEAVDCGVPTRRILEWSGLSKSTFHGFRSSETWSSVRVGRRPSMTTRLRELGVLNNKHIPVEYLRASTWQRLALLQGLMDADGTVVNTGKGQCVINLREDELADDLADLLSGLGIKWTRQTHFVNRDGNSYGPYTRFRFTGNKEFPVFRLARKCERLPNKPSNGGRTNHRQIVSIEPVPSVPVRCVQVDSPHQLYLAGRKMVPTHNSSLAETACTWGLINGHSQFVCLIGSDEGHACDMLDSIKTELESNELLLADYPEVCYPIQSLEGISNRANGQLYQGKRTHIGWTAKEIVLPTIKGSVASGAIIKVAGLTGRIRGMKMKTPDGRSLRPSLVVLDDPQTDDSARSLSQCANRESILAGAVLGLAGPGKKISGIMPCTVIRPGDMADNILDRNRHPEWNGERTKMVYAFPKNEALWERYAEIRAEGMRGGDGGEAATEFYRQNRASMDEGAVVAWQERFNYDELSAIQHAMNLKLQDESAFFAEYQNEPLPAEKVVDGMLKPEEVASKINRMDRGLVSIGANHLTAFIDVQQKLLFYIVAAWEDDFTGYVIDYGCYPDQQRPYFTLREARQTLGSEAMGMGLEGSIYAGLESLTSKLLDREWQRDDGLRCGLVDV